MPFAKPFATAGGAAAIRDMFRHAAAAAYIVHCSVRKALFRKTLLKALRKALLYGPLFFLLYKVECIYIYTYIQREREYKETICI